MRYGSLFMLLLALPLAGEPLRVVSVLRTGLPPYEDANRLYRLEGEACGRIRSGEALVLRRTGEARSLGCLKVTETRGSYVLARMLIPGETYPIKGDLALREEDINPLPTLTTAHPIVLSTALAPLQTTKSAPPVPAVPLPLVPVPEAAVLPSVASPSLMPVSSSASPSPAPVHPMPSQRASAQRQPIYFLKGDASLSPGALAKLKSWTGDWGADGQWMLACPGSKDPAIAQERIQALKSELLRLGVGALDVRPLPEEVVGKYEAIYVIRESR